MNDVVLKSQVCRQRQAVELRKAAALRCCLGTGNVFYDIDESTNSTRIITYGRTRMFADCVTIQFSNFFLSC